MKRKQIICAAILSITIFNSTIAFAVPTSEELKQQQNQLSRNKSALSDVQDKREELESSIQSFDDEIESTMDAIEDYKIKIKDTEKDIKNTEVEVKKAEEAVKSQEQLLGKRVRAIYKSGQESYISMLVESEDVSDFLSRLVNIKRMIDYDKKNIAGMEAKKTELDQKKQELDSQKESIIAMQKDSENKLVSIREKSLEQNKLIDELKKQEKVFASKVNESQAIVDASLAQIKSIRSTAPKYVPSRGAASVSDNSILAYASNFLGTPYVWGGTSPVPGFDCSGFTRYVFAHFGINLGRTTKDQIHDGYAVAKEDLKPGDLVFFGNNGVPHHMGIYLGNNTYIHAPQTGDVVKISPMNRRDFITGRRVI